MSDSEQGKDLDEGEEVSKEEELATSSGHHDQPEELATSSGHNAQPEELATSSGHNAPSCARRRRRFQQSVPEIVSYRIPKRFPPREIPVIGAIETIEQAEASLLYGIITGDEAVVTAVNAFINSESVEEAGINALTDLANIAIERGTGIAFQALISQFVGS